MGTDAFWWVFLAGSAAAVGYYVHHREHRAAIGTVEEYERLRRPVGGAS